MGADKLIYTVVDEGILIHVLDGARSLQLHVLNSLEHIYHALHTKSLNAETQRTEDARGT